MTSQNHSSDSPENAKILVVDDLPENLHLLKQILIKQGYEVRFASSGKLALRSLTRFQPDLILLDIMMPGMDGFVVCQTLKANPETQDIPVIFLSAIDEQVDKVKAFQVGGSDYVTKPFQTEEVLARIRYQLFLHHLQKQLQQKNQELLAQNEQLQQAQRETQLLLEATRAIEKSHNLQEAISLILDVVCQNIFWDYGEGWLPNTEIEVLEYVSSHHPYPTILQNFQDQSRKVTFAFGQGLPGRIWKSQQTEWIEDCSTCLESVYIRVQLAIQAGLKAAFGVPIMVEGNVLAILVFYHSQPSPPQNRTLELVQAVASQLSSPLQQAQLYQKLQQANQELERLAKLDGLTQIPNRRYFDLIFKEEWLRMQRQHLPLSLILCDVDHFKRYNDYYGHLAGDDCLIQIAQTLDHSVKRTADLVARYGGEEFAIILPYTDTAGAIAVAERILTSILDLQIPHIQSENDQIVTVSLGVATIIPSGVKSPTLLVRLADDALYQAKKNGRNTYFLASETSV